MSPISPGTKTVGARPRSPMTQRRLMSSQSSVGARGAGGTISHSIALKTRHHARSARNEALSRMVFLLPGGWCTAWSKSIIRRRKDRPERTTLQAWLRRPRSDSSSFLEQALRLPHPSSKAFKRSSLSGGSHSWPATVSIVIP